MSMTLGPTCTQYLIYVQEALLGASEEGIGTRILGWDAG